MPEVGLSLSGPHSFFSPIIFILPLKRGRYFHGTGKGTEAQRSQVTDAGWVAVKWGASLSDFRTLPPSWLG